MRFLRIIGLHFEQGLQYRSRSFLWFLLALLNPAIYLLFWTAVIRSGTMSGATVSLPAITTYYLLLVIAGALLMAHIEEDVASVDIKEGGLVKYTLKPYPYFWLKFFEELPYRIIQGGYGVIGFILLVLLFGAHIHVVSQWPQILIAIAISVAAYFISFVFKMLIGISAFWIDDFTGLQQLVFVLISLFAGFIEPLEYFAPMLRTIAFATPFPYMIYYPVVAWSGSLPWDRAVSVLGIQMGILAILTGSYIFLWRRGIRQFTAVGQ
jgi:ABC-2 type transport system permease protein